MPAESANGRLDCSEPGTLLRRSIYPDKAGTARKAYMKNSECNFFLQATNRKPLTMVQAYGKQKFEHHQSQLK